MPWQHKTGQNKQNKEKTKTVAFATASPGESLAKLRRVLTQRSGQRAPAGFEFPIDNSTILRIPNPMAFLSETKLLNIQDTIHIFIRKHKPVCKTWCYLMHSQYSNSTHRVIGTKAYLMREADRTARLDLQSSVRVCVRRRQKSV